MNYPLDPSQLTHSQRHDLAHALRDRALGSADGPAQLVASLDLDDSYEELVEELLLDANVEECPECGWWHDSGELVDEDGEPGSCVSCRNQD